MNITISRNNEQFGPYTIEQVNTYLASGQLLSNDLAWFEGAPNWAPLNTIPGVVSRAGSPPPPPPPPIPSASAPKSRNVGVLILMAFVWGIVFWAVPIFMAGVIVGVMHPKDASEVGRHIGMMLGPILFLVAPILSTVLTIFGFLPGTFKKK